MNTLSDPTLPLDIELRRACSPAFAFRNLRISSGVGRDLRRIFKAPAGGLPSMEALPKPSNKMTYGMLAGIGGEGGIRTLGPGLPRTTA